MLQNGLALPIYKQLMAGAGTFVQADLSEPRCREPSRHMLKFLSHLRLPDHFAALYCTHILRRPYIVRYEEPINVTVIFMYPHGQKVTTFAAQPFACLPTRPRDEVQRLRLL
jgi:hypothetical protein